MWWVVLTSLVTSAAQETAMETTQPWLSAPSQQPSCLCPTVQVWKISTLVIICFTWQNLLLQLMTQMHYCQKDCCLVRYRHYKGIQLHLAFLQGFPCIEGSWGFLWTIWCLLYCAHTSPACELTYNLCLEFVACCWHKTISALDNGLYQVNKENISHFVNINKESQEPLHCEAPVMVVMAWMWNAAGCSGAVRCRVPWTDLTLSDSHWPLFSEIVTKPLPMVILFKWANTKWCIIVQLGEW